MKRARVERLAVALATAVAAVVVLVAAPATARAQSSDDDMVAPATDAGVAAGAVMPVVNVPQVPRQALVRVDGGWDTAGDGYVGRASATLRVWGPFAIFGGAQTLGGGQRLRPTLGVAVQLARADRQPVASTLSVAYKAEGFDEPEGEIEATVSVARALGGVTWTAIGAYGQDPEGNERDAELGVAGQGRLGARAWVGAGATGRTAIGAPGAGEPSADLAAGPHLTVLFGSVAVTAFAGARVVSPDAGDTRAGVMASLGFGYEL